MAAKLKAINALRPKIRLKKYLSFSALVKRIASRSSLNTGEIQNNLSEFFEAIRDYNLEGQNLKLPGLGTFGPKIGLDGKITILYRPDKDLLNALNTPGGYAGEIENAANIGKTAAELVTLWNELHPEDPVTE